MCVCVCVCAVLSCVQLFVIPWTAAHQVPLSMGFSRQEYWSGLLFSPPGDLPDPGIKPSTLVSPALADRFFTTAPPGRPNFHAYLFIWKSHSRPDSMYYNRLSCAKFTIETKHFQSIIYSDHWFYYHIYVHKYH